MRTFAITFTGHRPDKLPRADILIALYDGTADGGTAYTVDYARKRGRKIIVIHPDTLARTHI